MRRRDLLGIGAGNALPMAQTTPGATQTSPRLRRSPTPALTPRKSPAGPPIRSMRASSSRRRPTANRSGIPFANDLMALPAGRVRPGLERQWA